MTKRNAANERVKRRYLQYLKEVKGRDEASIDAVAKAIDRFEETSRHRDFKKFHIEQARAFKAHLAAARNARTGEPLSASTVHSTLAALKAFSFGLPNSAAIASRIKYCGRGIFQRARQPLPRRDRASVTRACPTIEAGPRNARRHAGEKRNRKARSGARRLRAPVGRAGSGDRLVSSLKHIDVET